MKKTWLFGWAIALGVPVVPVSAQYNAMPYSNGALAPSGYAVPDQQQQPVYQQIAGPAYGSMNGVAQLPQYAQPQMVAQPGYGYQNTTGAFAQPGPQASMVAYPQEQIAAPAPGFNSNQAPDRGWVGPNNGQYQPQPGSHSVVQPAPQAQIIQSPMQSAPMNTVPMNGSPMAPSAVGSMPMQGPGCGDGGYGMPAYGNVLAPTATAPMMSGGCGAPAYAGPVYAGPIHPSAGFASGFLSRSSIPGRAFFAGGGALLFRRVDDHNVALTYNTTMPSENTLSTRDARQHHLNGFEVFAGRYFNCGRNAFMVNYWGLFPEDRTAQADAPAAPSAYRSRYHFNGIQMPTQSVYDWYDGAISHRIVRGSEYHNVEANLLGFAVGGAARTWTTFGPSLGGGLGARFGAAGYATGCNGYSGGYAASCGSSGCGGYDACGSSCGSCGPSYASCGGGDCSSCGAGCAAFTGPCGLTPNMCGSRLNWTWLAGFRWFRFTDRLQYSASEVDYAYNGGVDDLYWDNNVRNDLYGFQLGGAGTYCLGQRFNLYALSKAGIFNNHSTLYTRIGRNGGGPNAVVDSTNVYDDQAYLIDASQNNAAVLGELGTGVGARITRGWSANVGYRVIGVSGVATAVNTIPIEMIHLGNVADYNTTSSVILHGLTLGGMYNF